jgi:stalled ribosome rescue protein Dom34
VFESRVLRRIFGSKRDEVTGEWRKLHNEELNDLYFLPDIMKPHNTLYDTAKRRVL